MHRRIAPFADRVLPFAATIAMLAALWCVFVYAPNERTHGAVAAHLLLPRELLRGRRISASSSRAGASARYLRRGRPSTIGWRRPASRSACSSAPWVLVTGPIWARPIWGAWWTWDPRLTMTVILWTIFAVYLVLRSAGRDEPRSRYAAVLADRRDARHPAHHGLGASVARHAPVSDLGAGQQGRSRGSAHGGRAAGHARGVRARCSAWLLWLRYEGLALARRAAPSGRSRGRARPMNALGSLLVLVRGLRRDLDPARAVPRCTSDGAIERSSASCGRSRRASARRRHDPDPPVRAVRNAPEFTDAGTAWRCAPRRTSSAIALVVEVADTGIGISPEGAGASSSTCSARSTAAIAGATTASGSGLYIVRRLTSLLGGTIAVGSAVGRGSRFEIRFPLRPCGTRARPMPRPIEKLSA